MPGDGDFFDDFGDAPAGGTEAVRGERGRVVWCGVVVAADDVGD
jgi:hypothetical protein